MSNSKEISGLIDEFLDFTAPPERYWELGIFKFAKYFYPEYFNNDFGMLHYEMVHLWLSTMSPDAQRATERQRYFLVHREAAKSTVGSFLIPLYSIWMNGLNPKVKDDKGVRLYPVFNEDYILIVSETATQAEGFITQIKDALDDGFKNGLATIFGDKNPSFVEDHEQRRTTKKWTASIFRTADGITVRGAGSGQRLRGTKTSDGKRPSTIIIDDMYSRENTKTKSSLESMNNWFDASLTNTADSYKGKMIWLGTMVHPDIVVKAFRLSSYWKGIERPIISLEELYKLIRLCESKGVFEVPPREFMAEKQKEFKTLSWAERHDLHFIAQKYHSALEKNTTGNNLDYFYMEYMNMPMSKETQIIKEGDIIGCYDVKLLRIGLITKIEFNIVENGYTTKYKGVIKLKGGCDLASSLRDKADMTALAVGGIARVWPVIPGTDEQQTYRLYPKGMLMPIVMEMDLGHIDVLAEDGLASRIINMYNKYGATRYEIEANGQQEMAVRYLERKVKETLPGMQIYPRYTNTEKSERIMSVVKPMLQSYKRILVADRNEKDKRMINELYTQISTLPLGNSRDDLADAFEKVFWDALTPEVDNPYIDALEGRKKQTKADMILNDPSLRFLT